MPVLHRGSANRPKYSKLTDFGIGRNKIVVVECIGCSARCKIFMAHIQAIKNIILFLLFYGNFIIIILLF